MITIIITQYPKQARQFYKSQRPKSKFYYVKNWEIGLSSKRSHLITMHRLLMSRKENKDYCFIKRWDFNKDYLGNIKQFDKRIRNLTEEIIFYIGERY